MKLKWDRERRVDEHGFPIFKDTKLRKLARTENWALFLLYGIRGNVSQFVAPHLSPGLKRQLISSIDEAILNIKHKQFMRKQK